MKWLIAVDGSSHSKFAFYSALGMIDRENDFIYLYHAISDSKNQADSEPVRLGVRMVEAYEKILKKLGVSDKGRLQD